MLEGKTDDGQLMVLVAMIIAIGMAAFAFVAFTSFHSIEKPVKSEKSDIDLLFGNIKESYKDSVKIAYRENNTAPSILLNGFRRNISRFANKHGYTVILKPQNLSKGYDLKNQTFEGGIILSDGDTTLKDDFEVVLTN